MQERCVGDRGPSFELAHADGGSVCQKIGVSQLCAQVVQIVCVVTADFAAGFISNEGYFFSNTLP